MILLRRYLLLLLGASAAYVNAGTSNVFVVLKESSSLALGSVSSQAFPDKKGKKQAITDSLLKFSKKSQAAVLSHISSHNRRRRRLLNSTVVPANGIEGEKHVTAAITEAKATSFWITNRVYIENANDELISSLREMSSVSYVVEEKLIKLQVVSEEPMAQNSNTTITTSAEIISSASVGNSPQYGVDMIEADNAWVNPKIQAAGKCLQGEGIVVASIDTGVRVSHESLQSSFINNGYGWFDPYANSAFPEDKMGHGTHTMGTMVGQKGIGVAPKAKWMTCRGCNDGTCSQSALLKCAEFILCPTNPNGQNRDCTKAPDVVNNSWNGGQGETWFADAIKAWHSAGIIPVFSNGNKGPTCGSVESPSDIPKVISVGAVNSARQLWRGSAHGPSVNGQIKPDLVAPGQDILSASHTGDDLYVKFNGTSMAAPHVTGAIALLLSQNKDLSFESVQMFLQTTASKKVTVTAPLSCGNIPENQFPNNAFGYGLLDIDAAINQLSN